MRNPPSTVRYPSWVRTAAAVLLLASGFGTKAAPNVPLPDIPANPPSPAKILYLFPKGEGDGIPTGNEKEIADQMVKRVNNELNAELNAKFSPKVFGDLTACPTGLACEAVQIYAEKRGNMIAAKLKFELLRGVQSPHDPESKEKSCLIEEGTDIHDCLKTDLELLAPELISHYRIYHDLHHGGDR